MSLTLNGTLLSISRTRLLLSLKEGGRVGTGKRESCSSVLPSWWLGTLTNRSCRWVEFLLLLLSFQGKIFSSVTDISVVFFILSRLKEFSYLDAFISWVFSDILLGVLTLSPLLLDFLIPCSWICSLFSSDVNRQSSDYRALWHMTS